MAEPGPDRPIQPKAAPVCSIGAICCMAVIVAVFVFLTTPEGRAFNEQVFGRFYTLGMIFWLAVYGFGGLGLLFLGVVLAVKAWLRREQPVWLRRLAVATNIVLPLVAFLFYSYA